MAERKLTRQIMARLDEDLGDALERYSQAEDRPMAWATRQALRAFLTTTGYLP